MAEDLELNFIGGPAALQGLAGAGIKRQSRWERRKDKKRQKQEPADARAYKKRPSAKQRSLAVPTTVHSQLKGYALVDGDASSPVDKVSAKDGSPQTARRAAAPTASPAISSISQPKPHLRALRGSHVLSTTPPAASAPSAAAASIPDRGTKHGRTAHTAGRPAMHTAPKPSATKSSRDTDDMVPTASGFDSDIMAAVRLSLEKDAALEAATKQQASAHRTATLTQELEADGLAGLPTLNVVTFPNAHQPPKAAKKARQQDGRKAAPKQPGPKPATWMTGDLTHVLQRVPADLAAVQSRGSFASLGLAASLADHLEAINFSEPTEVQRAAIPVLLAGRDALVKAPTGSGKTLAYLAPIVHDLQAQQPRLSRGEGTHAVILAPTRELCLQIHDVLSMLLRRYHWLVGGSVYGGESRSNEKARLRRGITILVATPGRLLDHLQNTTSFRSHALRWCVLDEADRLLDLGFEHKIGSIFEALDERSAALADSRRQTVLLSATLPAQLGRLASLSMQDPVAVGFSVTAKPGGQKEIAGGEVQTDGTTAEDAAEKAAAQQQQQPSSIPKQLRQLFVEVPAKQRLVALAAALRHSTHARGQGPCKVVVFLSSCDGVEFHHRLLTGPALQGLGSDLDDESPLLDCPVWKLHGSMLQSIRTQVFVDFSKCKRGVLICTDVAARGLDFPAVSHIVQFDPPGEASEYVHRVGRAARMGRAGEALLFLLPSEREFTDALQDAGAEVQEVDLMPMLNALPPTGQSQGKAVRSPEAHPGAAAVQQACMQAVTSDAALQRLACDAFRSFIRAYSTHPAALRHIFHTRRLHLGHVAHSFGLRGSPSLIGKSSTKGAFHKDKKHKLGSAKKHLSQARKP